MKFKNVLVTGGSSGIGLDLAKAYAAQGANVVLLARNQGRLDAAVKECLTECVTECVTADQKVIAFSVDVGDADALSATVGNVKAQMGPLDLMILSAGIVQSVRFMEQSDEDFNNIMHTNVVGSRAVAKAFLPEMIKQQWATRAVNFKAHSQRLRMEKMGWSRPGMCSCLDTRSKTCVFGK